MRFNTLPPTVKGQLTKAVKTAYRNATILAEPESFEHMYQHTARHAVSLILRKLMPKQQAKHAARAYMAQH